jgi:hypothetical protein
MQIRYSLEDVPQSRVLTALKDKTISIETLKDLRREKGENPAMFTNGRGAKIDGKNLCINGEKEYQDPGVSESIAAVMVSHFSQRGAFQSVLLHAGNQADYTLTADLERFYGAQGFSISAVVGTQFGLIGALMTAGVTTNAVIHVKFSGIRLIGRNGTLVKTIDDIEENVNEPLSVDANCWAIYTHVNETLKRTVDKLAEAVEKALLAEQFQTSKAREASNRN